MVSTSNVLMITINNAKLEVGMRGLFVTLYYDKHENISKNKLIK